MLYSKMNCFRKQFSCPQKIEGSSLKATNMQYRTDEITFAIVSTVLEG